MRLTRLARSEKIDGRGKRPASQQLCCACTRTQRGGWRSVWEPLDSPVIVRCSSHPFKSHLAQLTN